MFSFIGNVSNISRRYPRMYGDKYCINITNREIVLLVMNRPNIEILENLLQTEYEPYVNDNVLECFREAYSLKEISSYMMTMDYATTSQENAVEPHVGDYWASTDWDSNDWNARGMNASNTRRYKLARDSAYSEDRVVHDALRNLRDWADLKIDGTWAPPRITMDNRVFHEECSLLHCDFFLYHQESGMDYSPLTVNATPRNDVSTASETSSITASETSSITSSSPNSASIARGGRGRRKRGVAKD
jgi:hypothetical protein